MSDFILVSWCPQCDGTFTTGGILTTFGRRYRHDNAPKGRIIMRKSCPLCGIIENLRLIEVNIKEKVV